MSFFSFSFFAEVTPSACTPDKLKYSLTSVAMEPATSDLLLQLVYEVKHVFNLPGVDTFGLQLIQKRLSFANLKL